MGRGTREVAPYSTSIAAAWEVVEKMRESVSLEIEYQLFANEDGTWDVAFGIEAFQSATTAPHAICLAALAAVGSGAERAQTIE